MQKQEDQATIDEAKRATEYLANERTFLAWIRTSIAVISLGFVVAKFSVWLRELSSHLDPQMQAHHPGVSLPLGVAMMTFGGLLGPPGGMALSRGKSRHRARQSERRPWTCDIGHGDGHGAFWSYDRFYPTYGERTVDAPELASRFRLINPALPRPISLVLGDSGLSAS